MVCKKARDLLHEKQKLQITKEENREKNDRILREYLENSICPDCGSTNIRRIFFESVPSVMGIEFSCIRYLLICEQCKCHTTTSGTHILDNRRSVDKYLLRKNKKRTFSEWFLGINKDKEESKWFNRYFFPPPIKGIYLPPMIIS